MLPAEANPRAWHGWVRFDQQFCNFIPETHFGFPVLPVTILRFGGR